RFNWLVNGNPSPGTLYRVLSSTAPDPLAPAGAPVTTSDIYNDFLFLSGLASQTTYYFTASAINNNGIATSYTSPQSTVTLVATASTLYFKNSVSPVDANAMDLTRIRGLTVVTSTKNTVAGPVTPPTTQTQFTKLAAGTTVAWYTDPLDAVTVTRLPTFNIWARESIGGANATVTAELLRADNAGNILSTISTTSLRPELTTALAAQNWKPASVTPTALNNGDRLAVRLYIDDGIGFTMNAGGRTVTVTVDGPTPAASGDSWVSVGESLAPARPAITGITAVYISSITAGWGLIRGTTGYTLAASLSPDNPPSVAASSTTLGDISATVSGLIPDTTYYLFARSNGPGASSSWAAYPGTSTLLEFAPLFSNFTNISSDTMRFNWLSNGNAYPATRYRVYVSTAADPLSPGAGQQVTISDTNEIYLSTAGLNPDTTYYFRVAGVNNNYVPTAYTAAQGTATLLAFPPTSAIFNSAGTGAIQFSWSPNGNVYPGTKFRVLVSTASPLNPGAGQVVTASDTYGVSLSSAGLYTNTTYYFAVAGVNINNVPTGYTTAIATATLANLPLTAVSTFSAVSDEGFTAAWNNNSNPLPQTTYEVQASTASNFNPGVTDKATALTAPAAGPSYVFTGLTFSTTYYFRVRAVNHSGVYTDYTDLGSTKTLQGVWVNEVYPAGAAAPDDWVEFYNNANRTISLAGWTLNYVENTIDLGGTPNLVWTGQAGDVITAKSTFTVSGLSMNLNGGLSAHVRLQNGASVLVDQVQWPGPGIMSAGQSFARITDGNPDYFEIDPTPTKNYAAYCDTDAFRINEVSFGSPGAEFIELYNASAVSTQTLTGYALRNSAASGNGLRFRFTRKIYPLGYAVIDFSSLSDDALTYADVFGPQGLAAAGDFLALENSTGTTVDEVTWQSGANYTRYNYKASLVSVSNPAPAGEAYSIGRQPSEGADTGVHSIDFTGSVFSTLGSRNNGAGTAAANTLSYPLDNGLAQYLARKFPLTMAFGANSVGGAANTVVFQRTAGTADQRSPHVYRLADIGFDLSSLTQQTTAQTGLYFNDQDGYPLVSSAAYRVTFNTDTGSQSAPQIILGTVTYQAAVHAVTGSTAAPVWMNNAARSGIIKLDVSNNSPAGFNSIEVATVPFRIMNRDLSAALTTQEARNLFNALLLVRDSTSSGVYGLYEPLIDVSTIAYIPMAGISLDAGVSTLSVVPAGLAWASIPAASTRTFYLVFESTQNASDHFPSTFTVRFNPAAVVVRDGPGALPQDFTPSGQVDTSSVSLIAPAQPPAGTSWPYISPSSSSITSLASFYTAEESGYFGGPVFASSRAYITSTDGKLRAVNFNGGLIWTFTTSPLSPINTNPEWRVESGLVYIYFANDNGDVYKVRDDDATVSDPPIWKRSLGTQIRSNVMSSG
ncbi:MAG: fibronectin type III domain-containing protein, partial [Elusimicrobiota bacterium]